MFFSNKTRAGFTLIEILIVISIVALVAGILAIGFQNYASYQNYNQAVGDVEFALNQSRVSARSAVGDEPHGIKFANDRLTQFIGDSYVAGHPDNEVIIYNLVTLQPDLTGGVDEIVFDKLSGLPSATGTVVISGTVFVASTTIQISDTGVIQ